MNDGLRSIDVAADGERPTRAVRPPGLESDLAIFRPAAIHGRWGLGLMAIGWVHLATFMSCHVLYVTGDRRAVPYMAVWCLELAVVVALIRRMVTNNGRIPPPPMVGLLARVWITFILIGLSAVSINRLSGMPPEWFKAVWCALSAFGFAMTAWLVSLWFLAPAVQMSLTGLLMVSFPMSAYLIYAVSWWLSLHGVAFVLERARLASLPKSEAASRVSVFRFLLRDPDGSKGPSGVGSGRTSPSTLR